MKQYLIASNLMYHNPTKFQKCLDKFFVAELISVYPVYNWWGDLIVSRTESEVLFLFSEKVSTHI